MVAAGDAGGGGRVFPRNRRVQGAPGPHAVFVRILRKKGRCDPPRTIIDQPRPWTPPRDGGKDSTKTSLASVADTRALLWSLLWSNIFISCPDSLRTGHTASISPCVEVSPLPELPDSSLRKRRLTRVVEPPSASVTEGGPARHNTTTRYISRKQ